MNAVRATPNRELRILLAAWLFISLMLAAIAITNRSSPGLYYDEAVFAGLAKDFVDRTPGVLHMPGTQFVTLLGRPFPIFVQSYFGAFKSWLIIPSFLIFGSSVAVLRLTALFWCLIGLLFFMLWSRKLLGFPTALVAAFLLAFDPAFFFLSVFDWGGVVPSFLCRMSGFYFLLLWARHRKARYGLAAAVLLGVGVYSKIDFVVVLVGCGIAVLLTYKHEIAEIFEESTRQFVCCCAAFLLVASPMFGYTPDILEQALVMSRSNASGGISEKLRVAQAMYDGSYFHRLMDVGGIFSVMFASPSSVWSPFGLVVAVSAMLLTVRLVRARAAMPERRGAKFLLLSLALITIGVLLLPGAVRMHHSILVYPFPHLVVAAAVVMLWEAFPAGRVAHWGLRTCAIGIPCLVLVGHLNSTLQTERLIQATGGRGMWSNALQEFCNNLKDESGVSIVSLDWGFNEQMDVLGDNRHLSEPIWPKMQAQRSAGAVYLVHPPEYTFFPRGKVFFSAAKSDSADELSIRPYRDRQGNVAFYSFRFVGKGRSSD